MMEELLVKVKDEKESSFIRELLKKLKIQFETIGEHDAPSDEEVKQSVINGQLAYKNGETDQLTKIDRKDLWKYRHFLALCVFEVTGNTLLPPWKK